MGDPGPTELLPQPRLRPDRRRCAVLILAIAAGVSWYNDHLAPVGSVDGQSITKDEFSDRYKIESWRLDEAERRVRTAVVAGQLTEAQGRPAVSRSPSSASSSPRPRSSGSSTPSSRPGWPPRKASRRRPRTSTPGSRRGDHPRVASRLGDRGRARDRPRARSSRPPRRSARPRPRPRPRSRTSQGGKSWDDVAKTVSTDASTGPQAGDLGWLQADDTQTRRGLPQGRLRRRGRTRRPRSSRAATASSASAASTEIAPATVDAAYQAKLENEGIDLAKYRAVVLGDVIHEKLEDKIVARRHRARPAATRLARSTSARPTPSLGEDAVKIRHILYSPEGRPGRTRRPSPANDPAWAVAESQATATYVRLKADPNLFDSIARKESDEGRRRARAGAAASCRTSTARARSTRRSRPRSSPRASRTGDILAPVKSAFGWHVIQVMYRPTDDDQLKALKTEADGGHGLRDPRPGQLGGAVVGRRRRPRLGRQGPARRPADRMRSSPRRSARPRTIVTVAGDGIVPVQGLRRGDPDARGPPARGADLDRLLAVVRREEVRGHHHARRIHHGRATS